MKILRDYNGGVQNALVFLSDDVAEYMDIDKYISRLKEYVNNGLVKIIDANYYGYWCENIASIWFKNNYKEFGYTKIIQEHTKEFKKLKEELKFYGRPDYLVLENGIWKIAEIECWVHKYIHTHPDGYADIVVAYDSYREEPDNVRIITMKGYYGVDEIISKSEIPVFLYLYDEEFRDEYNTAVEMTQELSDRKW